MDYALIAPKTDSMDRTTGSLVFGHFNQMFRNTLCNNLDTMNNKLLRAGKPRIHVRSIDNNGKTKFDLFGKPLDDADPDAMVTLFFQKAGDSRVVFVGKISPAIIENNAEAQRCMRKAKEHEVRVLEDSLNKNDARHAFAYKELGARKDTEIEKLKAENAELKAAAQVTEVGEKRPRTDDELVDKIQQMLNGTVIKQQNQYQRQQIQDLRDDKAKLHAQIRLLKADNEKKVLKNLKLCKTAKKSAATLGSGTRVWASFLDSDLTDLSTVIETQKSLQGTIGTVHVNRYIEFLDNAQGMRGFNQRSLDRWCSKQK